MSLDTFDNVFKAIDTSGDGKIQREEFVIGMRNLTNTTGDFDEDFELIFDMVDGSVCFSMKDGKLGKREFRKIYDSFPKPFPTDKRQADKAIGVFLFKVIDSNNSGKINKKELAKFLKLIGTTKKEDIDKFMKIIDTDNSNKISMTEFLEWYVSS
ncbi:hypothetical protein EIN_341920 [Entamoeba invadens IP1]|uniref:EF-hand domain-containing protein n=1 Tax=Entamoeba invadens IP1 TaxID=370355 RepID=A0A0A1UDV4_ENTIV|nr:hypothetical protein EIN_341920 [Entamoeba invadens IP1]ELP94774.1 hypothetical protein EIN_341920 [Entamoeba invadens IP1]|eukprot:XP_004261545.1 hypothetical protein EIN_341920 [Entamoeba invadens IP1]